MKKQLNKILKHSDKMRIIDLLGNAFSFIPDQKWKIIVEGKFKDMSSNQGFNNQQKREIAEIVKLAIEPVVQRLDVLENKVDQMMNTPTMKEELNLKK